MDSVSFSSTQSYSFDIAEWDEAVSRVINSQQMARQKRKHDFEIIRKQVAQDLVKYFAIMQSRSNNRNIKPNNSEDDLIEVILSDDEIKQTIARSRWKFIRSAVGSSTFRKMSHQGLWDIVTLLQNRDKPVPHLHELISSIQQRQQKEAMRLIQETHPDRIHHEAELRKMLRIVAIQNNRSSFARQGDALSDLEYKVVQILTKTNSDERSDQQCALVIQLLKRILPEHSTLFKWLKDSNTKDQYILARELEYVPASKNDIIMWQGTVPDNKQLAPEAQNAPYMNENAYIGNHNQDRCYIILNGSVDVYVNKHLQEKNDAIYTSIPIDADPLSGENEYIVANWWDKGKKVATLGDGTMIGEMSLMYNQPRNATIISEQFSEFLCLRQNIFNIMLKSVTQDIFASIQTDLRKFELFYNAQEEYIKPVLKSFKYVKIAPGQKLQFSNQKVSTIYFVLDGTYQEYTETNHNRESSKKSHQSVNWCHNDLDSSILSHNNSTKSLRRSYVLHSQLKNASQNLSKQHHMRFNDKQGLEPLLKNTIHAVKSYQRRSRKKRNQLHSAIHTQSPKQVHNRRWLLTQIGQRSMIGGYYAWNRKMPSTTIECVKGGTALTITSHDLLSSMHPDVIPKFKSIVKRDYEILQQRLQLIDCTRKHGFEKTQQFTFDTSELESKQNQNMNENTQGLTQQHHATSPSMQKKINLTKQLYLQKQFDQKLHFVSTPNQSEFTQNDSSKHNKTKALIKRLRANQMIGATTRTKTSHHKRRKARRNTLKHEKYEKFNNQYHLPRVQTAPTGKRVPKSALTIQNFHSISPSRKIQKQREKLLNPIPSVNRILLAKTHVPEQVYREKASFLENALRRQCKKQYVLMRNHLVQSHLRSA